MTTQNRMDELGDASELSRREAIMRVSVIASVLVAGFSARTFALGLADLSQKDAGLGVKAALEKGASIAVELLGREDGFWKNDHVRIPLPQWLEKGQSVMKMLGKSREFEDLKLGVNRAAEQAVPQAKVLLVNAVKTISVEDAKSILTGGENAVTKFFESHTRTALTSKFLPVVTTVTQNIGLAKQYNELAARVKQFGVVKQDQSTIEQHVTGKALDGLYYMIGEEEKKIRHDPVGTGSEILKKVFGGLR